MEYVCDYYQVHSATLGGIVDVWMLCYAMHFSKIMGMGSFASWVQWWLIYKECEKDKSNFIIFVLHSES